MARPSREAALNAPLSTVRPDVQALRLLYALLASGENPDGTPFALPTEGATGGATSDVNVTDRAARALGRVGTTLAPSLAASGSATAPAAAAVIASLAAPPAGSYAVCALVGYGGAASTLNNMDLRAGAAVLTVLPVLAVANVLQEVELGRVDLDGATALTVNAVAAGAAGTIFVAHLAATRIVV